MARFARVIAIEVAHHVTQRGNARQSILNSDADKEVYLSLLREKMEEHRASLIGYCLMSNHVHLVMVPHQADALATTLKHTHGRYAAYWNAKYRSSGHVWQGRYYSCPLDRPHLWEALRYTELNPVRAGLVAEAEAWIWSSAAVHCGAATADEMDGWRWKHGKSDGMSQVGGNFLPPEIPNRGGWPCGSVRTLGARWGPRSLSISWKRRQSGLWLLEREATPQGWLRRNGRVRFYFEQ